MSKVGRSDSGVGFIGTRDLSPFSGIGRLGQTLNVLSISVKPHILKRNFTIRFFYFKRLEFSLPSPVW